MNPTTPSTQALDFTEPLPWRKSSYSGDQGACVEFAPLTDGVAIRDSKDPDGPRLRFSPAAWTAFAAAAPPRPAAH
ncbi:DUF397 domain-containing protein [Solwaraspora sp. WMMD1047]|uniref:DUF397 domain-containing protein n=1 Tax=Solwaraspora sp. WMMD1047 TaxID=3016102 RepID=UPI002415C438|nr:DUF397 domain-containing protein [Solwaraspora sp. WMMD1047]MDG4829484.1 DUF397 domain-containing protein [Solwaraspora sp. WMMD1047]